MSFFTRMQDAGDSFWKLSLVLLEAWMEMSGVTRKIGWVADIIDDDLLTFIQGVP